VLLQTNNLCSDISYSLVQEDHLFNAMLRETVAIKLSIYTLEVKQKYFVSLNQVSLISQSGNYPVAHISREILKVKILVFGF